MADLLSPAQRAQIRLALKDVTDTFMKTPVVYSMKGESLDRFNEDRTDEGSTTFNFNALVEYPTEDSDKIQKFSEGALDTAEIMLTMNLEDLKAINFVNSSNICIGNDTKDYFTVNGEVYRVCLICYDGPLDQKNILVVIFGNKEKHKS